MKLRIRGDSLRVRLSPDELATLAAGDAVTDAIHFGPGPSQCLRCELVVADGASELDAVLDGQTIRVAIATAALARLAGSDEVGLSASKPVGAGRTLALLLEKDFRCLVPRPGEETEGFDRPDDAPGC